MAALAVLAAVLCLVCFQWRQCRLGDIKVLDERLWYTPKQAADFVEALRKHDASAPFMYATTELTLDVVFPIAYGLLFSILLFRLYEHRGFFSHLYLLALGAAVFDVLENIFVVLLVVSYDGTPMRFAYVAATLTLVKWMLIVATMLAMFVGLFYCCQGIDGHGQQPEQPSG